MILFVVKNVFLLAVREVIPSMDLWGKCTNNCTGNAPLTRGDAFGIVETFKRECTKHCPAKTPGGTRKTQGNAKK